MTDARKRCCASVFVRDTYRVSRRGDGRHFRMHYAEKQCSRAAVDNKNGSPFCRQHMQAGYVTVCSWAISAIEADPK